MKKTATPAAPTEGAENLEPVLGQASITTESIAEETESDSEVEEVPKLYPGKQQELYAYARIGWQNYAVHQAVFAAFAPDIYTVQFGVDQLAFIETTKALPDQDARVVAPLDAKDDLWELNAAVLDLFMDGTIYIERTWTDPTKQNTMLNAAGKNYYTKATNGNWTSTESLISAFKLFLTTYEDELLAANWMPATFPATFDTVSEPFLLLLKTYRDRWAAAQTKRSEKATNNNLIYTVLAEMCEVGKHKFRNNAVIRKKFTITALLGQVAGHSDSGFQGLCAINGNKRYPVVNVRLSAIVDGEERIAFTNEKGRYFLPLPSGDFTVTMQAEGYQPQTVSKTVIIGTKSYLNFTMVPVEMPAAPTTEAAPSVNFSKMVEGVVKKSANGVG